MNASVCLLRKGQMYTITQKPRAVLNCDNRLGMVHVMENVAARSLWTDRRGVILIR